MSNPATEEKGQPADGGPCENTDRHLWPETSDPYAEEERLFVTAQGGIGINVGGYVYVKPLREWHKLAGGKEAQPIPDPPSSKERTKRYTGEEALTLDESDGPWVPGHEARRLEDEIELLRKELLIEKGRASWWQGAYRGASETACNCFAPKACPVHGYRYELVSEKTSADPVYCRTCGQEDRDCYCDPSMPAEKATEPQPGPVTYEPMDYIVQCRCGRKGNVSQLKSIPGFKCGCPDCSAEFVPLDRMTFPVPAEKTEAAKYDIVCAGCKTSVTLFESKDVRYTLPPQGGWGLIQNRVLCPACLPVNGEAGQ